MPRRNNNNNNNARRGRRRNRNRKRQGNNTSGYRLAVSKNQQLAMPDSMIVDMPFTETSLTFIPAGANFGAFRYRGNSPFDPDPLLGGESALYFAQWATLYRRYRVLSVRIEVVLVNKEAFSVFVTMAPTDFDFVSSISSAARALDVGEMPYAVKPILLGPNGSQNRARFVKVVHWPKFIGNRQQYMADDIYGSLNNGNPAVTPEITFAVAAGTNFVNGIDRYVRIIYRTLWTDRNFDFTTLRIHHPLKDENEEDVVPSDFEMIEPQLPFERKLDFEN